MSRSWMSLTLASREALVKRGAEIVFRRGIDGRFPEVRVYVCQLVRDAFVRLDINLEG